MSVKIRRILERFEEISRIPRCSQNEDAVARWFEAWAGSRGYTARRDRAGNLLISIPSSPGCERARAVVLQGHLDMVCEKTPESKHDFSCDPIRVVRDGDWLHADGTTLGADNGVALALGSTLVEDRDVQHPRIELLFTVDEETGLNGAKKLEPGFVEGRILINLDSETEGVFTVGCAGGRDAVIRRQMRFEPIADDLGMLALTVGGLRGGHSGIDIHRHRANAPKLLARALNTMLNSCDLRLAEFSGGTKRNAIPRDARAVVACPPAHLRELHRQTEEFEAMFRSEYATETSLFLSLAEEAAPAAGRRSSAKEDAAMLTHLLLALPHGVAEMAPDFPDLVMSSSNLAIIQAAENNLCITTSQRSLTASGLDTISGTIRAVAALAGAQAITDSEYPPWTPNLASPLLARCREVYRNLYHRQAEVRALHAGLECAIIGNTYPGMDMISIGPTTENAHSPTERVNVPSLSDLWDFLAALLKSLSAS